MAVPLPRTSSSSIQQKFCANQTCAFLQQFHVINGETCCTFQELHVLLDLYQWADWNFAGCPKQVNNVTGAMQCSASYFTISRTNIFLVETQAVLCQNKVCCNQPSLYHTPHFIASFAPVHMFLTCRSWDFNDSVRISSFNWSIFS